MGELLAQAPSIIEQAAASPLAIVALCIMALSAVALVLFRSAADAIKLAAFGGMAAGVVLLSLTAIFAPDLMTPYDVYEPPPEYFSGAWDVPLHDDDHYEPPTDPDFYDSMGGVWEGHWIDEFGAVYAFEWDSFFQDFILDIHSHETGELLGVGEIVFYDDTRIEFAVETWADRALHGRLTAQDDTLSGTLEDGDGDVVIPLVLSRL